MFLLKKNIKNVYKLWFIVVINQNIRPTSYDRQLRLFESFSLSVFFVNFMPIMRKKYVNCKL